MPLPPIPVHMPPPGFPGPLTPHDAADTTIAALNFGTALSKLITVARERDSYGIPRFGAQEAINAITAAALSVSSSQVYELKKLRNDLESSGVEINKLSADQIVAGTNWWRRRQYRAVRAYRNKIRSLTDAFGDLYQELVSIAHCREQEDFIALTTQRMIKDGKRRDSQLRSDKPLGKILDELIADAEELQNELQNAAR